MYKVQHAHSLLHTLKQHNPGAVLHVLTDFPLKSFNPGICPVPLQSDWPHWWAKIELFRPGLFDAPVLYFDLDTIITGDVSGLPCDKFTMLECVYKPGQLGSGVMAWDGRKRDQYLRVFNEFRKNPVYYSKTYHRAGYWGDQAFIRDHLGYKPMLFGPECRSYKVHCTKRVPPGTKIVYFHGRPKPWEVMLKT